MKKNLIILTVLTPLIIIIALLSGAGGFGWADTSTATGLAVMELRLARVTAAFIAGVALSSAGCAMQAVLRNPLAEPYVLGISSGASLGAALMMFCGAIYLTPLALPLGAFVTACLTLLLVVTIARRAGGYAPDTLILTGVVVSTMLSSLLLLLFAFSNSRIIHNITWWMMGNLTAPDLGMLSWTALLSGCALLLLYAEIHTMNVLVLGSETAYNLGVNPNHATLRILAAATLATAAAVSLGGIIGFAGLVVPHTLRYLVGTNHRRLLPLSGVYGGFFLVLCDLLARTLFAPREIPVGVITALIGGPFFLALLLRRSRI